MEHPWRYSRQRESGIGALRLCVCPGASAFPPLCLGRGWGEARGLPGWHCPAQRPCLCCHPEVLDPGRLSHCPPAFLVVSPGWVWVWLGLLLCKAVSWSQEPRDAGLAPCSCPHTPGSCMAPKVTDWGAGRDDGAPGPCSALSIMGPWVGQAVQPHFARRVPQGKIPQGQNSLAELTLPTPWYRSG